jgi:hypothetical protein
MQPYDILIEKPLLLWYPNPHEWWEPWIFFLKILSKRSKLWHQNCPEKPCQLNKIFELFLKIIPQKLKPHQKISPNDFTRKRELTVPKIITTTLSITASGVKKGMDTFLGNFFKNARRSGVWPEAEPVHRSALSKARKKMVWFVFEEVLDRAVQIAYDLWPDRPEFHWHGMSIFAIDGSKYTLPATKELRQEFDPKSGLHNQGKGHYPQCLGSVVYDVFRRLPVAKTVVGIHGSERDEALKMLPKIPTGNVLVFDRGYPSFEFIKGLIHGYNGYFLMRCSAEYSFPALDPLVHSHEPEAELWLDPSNKYLSSLPQEVRKQQDPVKVRAIKMIGPEGTVSILLTNLFDRKAYPAHEMVELYSRRWAVEDHYRNEKVVMEVERFHAKSGNGIRQELFAAAIMTVIARLLMILSQELTDSKAVEPQFTYSVNALASDAVLLAAEDPEKSISIFKELIEDIARVKYYRSKKERPSEPRVNKQPLNKWSYSKSKAKKRSLC